MRRSIGVLLLAAAVWAGPAWADESWDFAGSVDLQSRWFTQDARWAGQEDRVGQFSIAVSAEARWRSADGRRRASFIPYLRWDDTDDERSLFDLREAHVAWEGSGWEFLAGSNVVFWGVTESVHLVDIINQTDAVADIDGEDKFGQPMLNLTLQRDWGLLGIFVMPYFRERSFAGPDGRFRTPLPVDTDRAWFESSAEENNVDLALRYSHYFGDVDLGVSLFSGTSREPRLQPDATGTALLPHYDRIDQLGVDLQVTRDAWLWKLETILRNGYADSFAAAVGGFEYTFYQVRETTADVGVLLEYQYDGRAATEPATIADNDLFAGARLALNDSQDTAILAGFALDLETGETLFNVEAERRLGNDYVIELRARFFTGAGPGELTWAVARDDYLQLQLSRYF